MFEDWRIIFLQNDPGFLNYLIRGLERSGIKSSSLQKDYIKEDKTEYKLNEEFNRIEEKNIIIIRCNDSVVPKEFIASRNFITTFNKKENRKNAYQKDVMMSFFNELKIDSLAIDFDQAIKILKNQDPVIIKATRHQGGDGIHFVPSVDELFSIASAYEYNILIERFTPFNEEYRVIVLNDIYLLVKKIFKLDSKNIKEHANKISKGGLTGYGYKFIDVINNSLKYNSWYSMSRKIVDKFKLEFCMIDIGIYKKQTHYIEINSSLPMPGPFVDKDKDIIGDYLGKEMVKIINKLIESNPEKLRRQ